jgi:hypothetical protein
MFDSSTWVESGIMSGADGAFGVAASRMALGISENESSSMFDPSSLMIPELRLDDRRLGENFAGCSGALPERDSSMRIALKVRSWRLRGSAFVRRGLLIHAGEMVSALGDS